MTPAIELAAESPRLEMLRARLKSIGLVPCDVREEPSEFEPILIDLRSASPEHIKLVYQQALQCVRRPFVLIGPDIPARLDDAILLSDETELGLLPGKLAAYYRCANTEREAALRLASVQSLTGTAPKALKQTRPSLLVVGGSSVRFLALQASLKANNIDVVAAFTVPTALDYLAKKDFSAVLISLDETGDNTVAESILSANTVSSLSRPLFVVRHDDTQICAEDNIILSQATEIFDGDRSLDSVAEDLVWQIFRHHSSKPMTPDQSDEPKVHDKLTGLFTRDFLEHHLQQQMTESHSVFLPLAFMTLTINSRGDENATARRCLLTITKRLQTLLRQTDLAARLDWTTIGFSLRRTAYTDAARLAERCSSAIAELGLPNSVSFAWRICEKRNTHTAKSLIGATMAARQIRGTIAAQKRGHVSLKKPFLNRC
ncbi:MAG: diguanylate cyclase [Pseudomonadota bacterium]